jgi:hypothetical protein
VSLERERAARGSNVEAKSFHGRGSDFRRFLPRIAAAALSYLCLPPLLCACTFLGSCVRGAAGLSLPPLAGARVPGATQGTVPGTLRGLTGWRQPPPLLLVRTCGRVGGRVARTWPRCPYVRWVHKRVCGCGWRSLCERGPAWASGELFARPWLPWGQGLVSQCGSPLGPTW